MWLPASRQGRLRSFRFHDLGHTAASTLVSSGVDVLTAQTDTVPYLGDFQGTQCGQTWTTDGNTGMIAYTWCQSLDYKNACDQHRIYYASRYVSPRSGLALRQVTCHEDGHGWGLQHQNDVGAPLDCTHSPIDESQIDLSAHYMSDFNSANY